MRFLNFTLIKLCIGFIIGIYLGFLEFFSLRHLVFLGSFSFISIYVFYKILKQKQLFIAACVLLFMVLGCITTYLHLPKNQPQHIYHLDIETQQHFSILAEVDEILRPNAYNHKYLLSDLRIDSQNYQGKILLNVSKTDNRQKIMIGDDILLYTKLLDFQKPKNPQTFDYASFMKNRDVYAVIYEDHFDVFKQTGFGLNVWAAHQRQNIVSSLRQSGFQDKHLELIQALILGQKQAINPSVYDDFAEVGVVHILAVSGLHVGIVFMILQFFLKPFFNLKHGRYYIVLFTVIGLWGFAALAGFSSSVMRAVTMFSFLTFGQLYRRKTNSINMLALSALALLLYSPQLLFEVGFQLSYAAVFSIVMLYPVFSKFYLPTYKIPKIFWDTAYVSLAAQIGVLPFQLYYFHQFPGLFLLGNLVIVPFLGILLSGGIICITLALMGILLPPFIKIYSFLLDLLLAYVDWLSQFKALVFKSIFFTKPMFTGIMLMVLCLIMMLREFKKLQIGLFLSFTLVFIFISINEFSTIDKISELIVFHQNKQTIIGVKHARHLKIYSDSASVKRDSYWLKNYLLLNRIDKTEFCTLKNSYLINTKKMLVVDSTGVYLSNIQNPIVLLSGSPDIHLPKLIKTQNPQLLIADGNNYKSYVERWRATAQRLNIPFHSTYEKGFLRFILDYNINLNSK